MKPDLWQPETKRLIQMLVDYDTDVREEGIIIANNKGNILEINNCGRKFLHVEAGQLNTNIGLFLNEKSDLLQRVFSGENIDNEVERILAGNDEQPYRISVQQVLNDNNEVIFSVLRLKPVKKMNIAAPKTGAITKYHFKNIVGESRAMQEAISTAEVFAECDENILVVGESGTGKELFAQAIHNKRRPHGPFIALNCAALPKELVESEIFGYEGGSFTGAERSGRPGKIELAEGGTLFLDEIGDMPPALQATLLRVLEDKQTIRVGGHLYKGVDFTVVAATNKNLPQMIEDKLFREDLYYRLSVLSVTIPPLRDRNRDALTLSRYFIDRYCREKGRSLLQLSWKAEQEILNYDWPGNVRQLKNALVFAINKTRKDTISLEDLPPNIIPNKIDNHEELQPKTLEILEKRAINNALEKSQYKVAMAAKVLGMSKSTLYRKLQRYGIEI